MAKESGPDEPADKVAWEIQRSRERLSGDVRALRYELDVPARIKRSFQQQTGVWVVGAVVVGALAMALPGARRRGSGKGASDGKSGSKLLETGFLLGAFRIAATLLKPVVISMIRNRMAGGGGFFSRSSDKS